MKLYHEVERVFNELKALGVGPQDDIPIDKLVQFDQYHYLGTEAVDEAIKRLDLNSQSKVLEVGAGIGGPSRHLSHRIGCHMTALELQPDLNDTAVKLTARCGLSDTVQHVCGNILDELPSPTQYDALVSWLTFLHIPDRHLLYQRCIDSLKPGGGLYVEDYFTRAPLSIDEKKSLAENVYCEHVPSLNDYRTEFHNAGFERIELIDMSEKWSEFVTTRREQFRLARERNLNLHGAEIVDGLDEFYTAVHELFRGGNLGGLRITAWKTR